MSGAQAMRRLVCSYTKAYISDREQIDGRENQRKIKEKERGRK
jgi:hypothetical protein